MTSKALTQIKNLEGDTDTRGYRAWRRVTKDDRGMSVQRLVGLVERVYAPSRPTDLSDLTGHIEDWEMALAEYERHAKDDEGVAHKMPTMAKIWAVRKLVTKDLEADLKRMCFSLRTYAGCKSYVEEQIATAWPAHFGDHTSRTNGEEKDSELDALLARIQELKEEEDEEEEETEESSYEKTIEEAEA